MQEQANGPVDEPLAAIEHGLLQREFLYDHPSDYRDGVTAAIAAIRDAIARTGA